MITRVDQPDGAGPKHLTRKSLRDNVYDEVLEMLLSGRLAPGESLGIDAVARLLGVSPSPVREALAELEHTGLISRTALRGYTVAEPLSTAQMSELFSARALVEVAAIAGVFPVAPHLIAALRQAHADHRSAADNMLAAERGLSRADWPTARAYYDGDWSFHLLLLENCGNRYLLNMAQMLSPHLHRLRQGLSSGSNDVEEATREHSRILSAVEGGSVKEAQRAMRDHLNAVRRRALADA